MRKIPYIKAFRVKPFNNVWAWTWRCPREDHALYSWCGGVFKTWQECYDDLRQHFRTEHDV